MQKDGQDNLDAAEHIAKLLASADVPTVVIGAVALVALKLCAGGLKSHADIAELLRRNPGANIAEIRATCRKYRLRGLNGILRELGH